MNTGVDLTIPLIGLFVCFLFGFFARSRQNKLYPKTESPYEKDLVMSLVERMVEDKTESSAILSHGSESDWDEICDAAIKKAKEGSTSARDWVTEHVYDKKIKRKDLKPAPEIKPELATNDKIINTTIEYLRTLGHKKGEATKMVMSLASTKAYNTVEDLVKDLYKR